MRNGAWVLLAAAAACAAASEPARFANGKTIPGEVRALKPEGLEIETPRGPAVFPWDSLSLGTRYRYQPGFREGFDGVLEGRPVPAGAEADARILSLLPRAAAPAAGPSPAPGPGAKPGPDAVATNAPKPAPKPPAKPPAKDSKEKFLPTDYPETKRTHPEASHYLGLRFGPGDKDVAYLLFDPKNVTKGQKGDSYEYDKLFVYIPGHAEYGTPQRVRGDPTGSKCEFKAFEFAAGADAKVDAKVDVRYNGGARSNPYEVEAEIAYTKGGKTVRYLALAGATASPKAVPVIHLTAPLQLESRSMEGGRKVFANPTIGKDIKVLPLVAPDTGIRVEVTDKTGKVIEVLTLKADKKTYRETDAWTGELRKLVNEQSYTVRCMLDLGPLGQAVAQEEIVYRDLKF